MLRALRDVGDDLVARAARIFLDQKASWAIEMRRALSAGDARTFHRAAHSLQGSSGTLGARRLAALCSRLIDLARADRLAECAAPLRAVEEELERVEGALRQLLAEPGRAELPPTALPRRLGPPPF